MRKQIIYQGRTLYYEVTGNGPVVVLLHGFGETASVWAQQVDHLQQNYTVLLPHLPGTPPSQMIEDCSMEGMAAAVHSILQQESVDACHLIGHSMGGYIALAFAKKYSQLLRGLGLFHSSAYADAPEKIATREKGIAFMQEHGGYAFLKTSVPNLYSQATKNEDPSLIEHHLASVAHMTAEPLIAYYKAMIGRPDHRQLLEHIQVPVLFVLGKEDTAVPIETGLQQCSLPDLCYIHILDRSGHMGMIEEPGRSNGLLADYLSETLETASA